MSVRSIVEAKAQAKALRQALAAEGVTISHSTALERVAKQQGARDWNTLQARLARAAPPRFQLNDPVRGRYLGQPFAGRIVALSHLGTSLKLSIALDQPIDTVRFEGMSNLRRRIHGTVDENGRSAARTSDGQAHLIVEPLAR